MGDFERGSTPKIKYYSVAILVAVILLFIAPLKYGIGALVLIALQAIADVFFPDFQDSWFAKTIKAIIVLGGMIFIIFCIYNLLTLNK